MSLEGKKVVVTRARAQAAGLVSALEARGAVVVTLPTICIEPPDDAAPFDAAIRDLASYDVLVLTSQNAVDAVSSATELPSAIQVASVGSKTAAAVRRTFSKEPIVPQRFDGGALADAISAVQSPDARVLIPQAAVAKGRVGEKLRAAGFAVTEVTAYQVAAAAPVSDEQAAAVMDADVITFLSGRTLQFLFNVLSDARARVLLNRALVAVIGPVAAEDASRLGVHVDVIAAEATSESLVDAVEAALS